MRPIRKAEAALKAACTTGTDCGPIQSQPLARRQAGSFAALIACMLAFALALLLYPAQALADDDENTVNPQQLPDSSFIFDTSIADLSTADSYFDKQTVQVVGEAVGDSIAVEGDPDHRWITLMSRNSDSNASISVLMTNEQAERIDTFGRYGTTGTMLQVRGTFYLVCPEHSGLTDLHAEHVSVVEKGRHHEDPFEPEAFIPGAVVVVIGLLVTGVFYWLRERRR